MKYACIAETKKGARCRRWAVNGNSFCSQHAKVKSVKIASPPDIILLKIRINKKWAKRFLEAGVSHTETTPQEEKERNYLLQAKKLRRSPSRYGKCISSGVSVFGTEGLSKVWILSALIELLKKGYEITNLHIEDANITLQKNSSVLNIMHNLVINMEKGEKKICWEEEMSKLLGDFLPVCWGFVHVWANPVRNGKVIHSLNIAHREPDIPPKLRLKFSNGLWNFSPYS